MKDRLLADLVNPLVITEVGALKPVAYDFSSAFDLTSIDELSPEQLSHYKQTSLSAFQAVIGEALAGLENHNGVVDWFDHCTRLSEARSVAHVS